MSPNDRRVALVSGANRGISRAIARQLIEQHGFLVLAGARAKQAISSRAPDRTVPEVDAHHSADRLG